MSLFTKKTEKEEIIQFINNSIKVICDIRINENQEQIEKILLEYENLCQEMKQEYVDGELDTFKKAACLLLSINHHPIVSNKEENAKIAIRSALKMCENPYWNVGEKYDVPVQLLSVNFDKAYGKEYETLTDGLLKCLLNEHIYPYNYISCSEALYSRYYTAVLMSNKEDPYINNKRIEEAQKKLEKSRH